MHDIEGNVLFLVDLQLGDGAEPDADPDRRNAQEVALQARHRVLLIVGEVVRFANPLAVAENFVVPSIPADGNRSVPATLFNTFTSQATNFGRDEEPIA